MTAHSSFRMAICVAASVLLAADPAILAQPQDGAAPDVEATPFMQEELEQILAPIALYPDSLIAQILMASTYPLEVVQADRWVKGNTGLDATTLTAALEEQNWDPSVKSLVNFPQVLTMMSEKLDWTIRLGDAFLAQQKEVMDTIQKLRDRAKAEGNLETTQEQTVIVNQEAQTEVIVIESSGPEVVYVPTYDPTVVYGAWPYPDYPPYYYYPPGYVARAAAISFGVGVACGAAWGYAWGGCDWHHGDVDIDIDRNAFVNNRIDRSRYRTEIGSRNLSIQNGRGSWQHDPAHRQGWSYRDSNTAGKFGGTARADATQARDSFRGRSDAGRQDPARGSEDQFKRGQPTSIGSGRQPDRGTAATRQAPARRSDSATQNRAAATDRSRQAPARRSDSATPSRTAATDRSRQGSRGGAFDSVGSGSSTRSASSRGQASRASSSSSGSRGSASRSGGASRGGASRGGGGGRGGGRR